MERKNQICEAGQQYLNSMDDFQSYHTYPREAFIDGAKWADEHPDSKRTYTKQQLIDMGFVFTTNGDIVPPDQLNEDLKKYLEYRKRKFIEKSVKYLEANFPDIENVGGWYKESFINNFRKAMEE